ncbi:MAG: 4Fe-4S dicluster domain-containing protein [Bacteroidetes bacterium]|nr:MAG: 4Fe-4S dicluster domain-containing protein [Bacteroidota bacterium]
MKSKNIPKKNDNIKSTSRRDFLKKGLLAGAGTVIGGSIVGSFNAFAENGDTLKVLGPDGKIMAVDKSHLKEIGARTEEQMQQAGREGIPGRKWVKVIDLSKCQNARLCMAACQNSHQLKPEQHHVNVLRMDRTGDTAPFFMPKPCQHCDDPPCTKVCPVDATFKRQDGLVLIDNERCIGCRFCIAACPYSARIFNWTEPKDAEKYKDVEYNIELNVPQKKGTVSKCLFSADLLREEKMPYCVTACPNGVYWFGDENENAVTNGTTKETVNFKNLLKDNAAYVLMPELGVKPRVYYLPEQDRIFPFVYNGSTEIKKEQH